MRREVSDTERGWAGRALLLFIPVLRLQAVVPGVWTGIQENAGLSLEARSLAAVILQRLVTKSVYV
jgi:hypothetical protein